MLEAALALSAAALVVATALLVLFGRRRASARLVVLPWTALSLTTAMAATLLGAGAAVPLGLGVGVLLLFLPRHWHVVGALFFAHLVVAFALYAVYLVRATVLLGGEPLGLFVGTFLLLLELAAMLLIATSAFEMVDALAAEPLRVPRREDPERWPVVCLQVPAYNEPPDLVIETVRSLVGLDYPHLRVQVIDNNTTDAALWQPVQTECERLRAAGHCVEFVHLPTWPGYKAGALNWGLAHLADDVELVGVVDADYVVDARWLRATVPQFADARVAFVQTPQDYRAWEGSAFYRACYAGFALFFNIAMVSRARRNAIIFAGTMGLLRRASLEAVGGWDEAIITEDAEVSVRLLQRGWQGIYVPVAYGRGIMPLTYEGLRKQRFRWAFGGIQILRRHWATLLPWSRGSRLTFAQRYHHLMGGLWWFNDALTVGVTAFAGAAAIGALLDRPFIVQRLSAVGIVLPLVFIWLNVMRYAWALRAATGAGIGLSLAALRVNLSLSWVIALACLRGLVQQRGVFLRPPKFRGVPAIRELRVIWVEATISALTLAALLALVINEGISPVILALAGLLAWSLLIYGSAAAYAVADPAREPLSGALRQKARLELRPRLGRAARSRPARAGLGVVAVLVALAAGLAVESGRPPVEGLAFRVDVTPFDPLKRDSPVPSGDPTATPEEAPTPGQADLPANALPPPAPTETTFVAPEITPAPVPRAAAAATPRAAAATPPAANEPPAAVPTPGVAPTPDTVAPQPAPTAPVPAPTPPPPADPEPRETPPVPAPTPPPASGR